MPDRQSSLHSPKAALGETASACGGSATATDERWASRSHSTVNPVPLALASHNSPSFSRYVRDNTSEMGQYPSVIHAGSRGQFRIVNGYNSAIPPPALDMASAERGRLLAEALVREAGEP